MDGQNLISLIELKQIMQIIDSIFLLFCLSLLSIGNADDSVLSHEFYTNSFTDNDFASWTITGNNIPGDHFFTQCGSQRIFGGYKKLGGDPSIPTKLSRQYTGLIAHYAVHIQAKIYKIDSYINESIFVMVDNKAQKIYKFQQTNSTQQICGDPYPIFDSINSNFNDSIVMVDFTLSHSSSVLNLAFQTDLNSQKGWWGLRDVTVTILECDKSCLTCTNASACTSCDASITGLTLIGAYCECTLIATIKQLITVCTTMPCLRCVTSCSTGYYYSAITLKCEPCHVACTACSGPSNTFAPACGPCSVGFFRNNPFTDSCYNCVGACSTCTALTSNACTACKQGYFLQGTQCLTSCPNGTYPEQATKQCFPCSPSCATCDGSTGFYCTSCSGLLYLTSSNQCLPSCNPPFFKYSNKCLQQCPLGTLYDFILYICTPCSSNCLECVNSTSCSKCIANYYLSANSCLSSCPTTHYPSLTSGICMACHSDCLSCFASSSTSCKMCSDPTKILLNNTCYSTCPNGTYSATCQPCHSSCLQCTGLLSTQCTSCSSPYFLDLTSNRCVQTCDIGTLVDKVNFTCSSCPNGKVGYFHECVPCSPTCLTCYGTSFLQCLTCDSSSTLYMSTCLRLNIGDSKTIKSSGKKLSLKSTIIGILVLTLIICAVLQMFFTYKTALLATIEFIQILGYMYFLSIAMSQEIQSILAFFYYTNFTSQMSTSFNLRADDLPLKISLMGKTGFYAIDTIGIHVVLIVAVLLMAVLKKLKQMSRIVQFIHTKLNPYLVTYLYRLTLLDQFFSLIIYLRYGGIHTALGIISLVILLIDAIILGLTLLWKIRPQTQSSNEYALFYFNQIQQVHLPQSQQSQFHQPTSSSKLNQASPLIALLFYVGKIPFPLAVVYFVVNGTYQAITLLAYSLFFVIMLAIVPYKRKIYRFLYSLGGAILVISSGLFIGVNQQQNYSAALEVVWLCYVLIVFVITLFQLLINYQFFFYFVKYSIQKIYSFLTQENNPSEPTQNDEQKSENQHSIDSSIKTNNNENISKFENQSESIKPNFQQIVASLQINSEQTSINQQKSINQIKQNKIEQVNEEKQSYRERTLKIQDSSKIFEKENQNSRDQQDVDLDIDL